jgi:Flp pilus assembly protein TadB
MVDIGLAAVVLLIIPLVAHLHLNFRSGFSNILIFLIILCIVVLVHVLRHRVEKFGQK